MCGQIGPFPNMPWSAEVFRKHCRKRKKCSKQAISLFATVFSICLEDFLPFSSNLKLSSAKSFRSEESKICCLGKSYTSLSIKSPQKKKRNGVHYKL